MDRKDINKMQNNLGKKILRLLLKAPHFWGVILLAIVTKTPKSIKQTLTEGQVGESTEIPKIGSFAKQLIRKRLRVLLKCQILMQLI